MALPVQDLRDLREHFGMEDRRESLRDCNKVIKWVRKAWSWKDGTSPLVELEMDCNEQYWTVPNFVYVGKGQEGYFDLQTEAEGKKVHFSWLLVVF